MYSQFEEEKYILEFFNGYKGRFLDIGAFDPILFSNTRELIIQGWEGILVEPSPDCYPKLMNFYKDNSNVKIVNIAIGNKNGELDFYTTNSSVSTANITHYNKWKDMEGHYVNYKKTQVPVTTWETFYQFYPGTYDFIDIDAEGMDYEILSLIDLNVTKTKLVCIEILYNHDEIIKLLSKKRFKMIYENQENVLMGIK